MTVEKIMRRDVVPVRAADPLTAARQYMTAQGLAAIPVVGNDGEPIGILTEDDLLVRHLQRKPLPWWKITFDEPEQLARDYLKRTGTTVADVMTEVSITVGPDAPVEHAAAVMHEHGLPVLLVVADGTLVGLLTRSDVLDSLREADIIDDHSGDPAQLVREMERQMNAEAWVSTQTIRVQAEPRVLHLFGLVRSEAERAALLAMARSIPGCVTVESHLVVQKLLMHI